MVTINVGDACVDELVEWFEDTASVIGTPHAVVLPCAEPMARQALVVRFHERIVSHPRFSGAWLPTLAPGSLAGEMDGNLLGIAPRVCWLGIQASEIPGLEAAQLVEQLESFGRGGNVDDWLSGAAYGGHLRASLVAQRLESAGDQADLAFACLGDPVGAGASSIAAAARQLDSLLEPGRLLVGGGVLAVDGPRPRTRAVLAAGWLRRIAETYPVVLVIDEAHRASRFATELVDAMLATSEPMLVILAGRPTAADATVLAGPFGTVGVPAVVANGGRTPLIESLSSDATIVVGELATSIADLVFTNDQLANAAAALGIDATPQSLLDELRNAGWVRRITADICSLSTSVHKQHALALRPGSRRETVAPEDGPSALFGLERTDATAGESIVTSLTTFVARTSTRHRDATWRDARLMARSGEIEPALSLAGSIASNAVEQAAVMAWWSASGMSSRVRDRSRVPALGAVVATDTFGTVEASLIRAALLAVINPELAGVLLRHACDALGEVPADPGVEETRLRLAAAGVALSIGDLDVFDRALGSTRDRWLSRSAAMRLAHLAQWKDQVGLVARSVEVLAGLELIAALRATMPGSEALGYALLARLELLERLGRLDTVHDAIAVADEAVAIFGRLRRRPPLMAWRARAWRAWCWVRHGNLDPALDELRALVGEQREALGDVHPAVAAAASFYARALAVAGRADDALGELDRIVAQRSIVGDERDAPLLEVRLHRADCLLALGRYDEALADAEAVLRYATDRSLVDEELELLARHRRGSALANAGDSEAALVELDDVIARRAELDLVDAPRLVSARHSRAVAFIRLERHLDALVELDEVLAQRVAALASNDPTLVDTRNDRAVCLLLLGRWRDALDDLDQVISARVVTLPPDSAAVVVARQQRAVCLAELARPDEARAEIEGIVDVTRTSWPLDHPLIGAVLDLRARLDPAPAEAPHSWPEPRPIPAPLALSTIAPATVAPPTIAALAVAPSTVAPGDETPTGPPLWLAPASSSFVDVSAAMELGTHERGPVVGARSLARRAARARSPWYWLAPVAVESGWEKQPNGASPWAPPVPLAAPLLTGEAKD